MAHVALPEGIPGIVGPLMQFPHTAKPLTELAQVLLRGPSTLTPGERELIAAYVSSRNECLFCTESHLAAARHLMDGANEMLEALHRDFDNAPVSPKMKALLVIAGKVQQDARTVSEEDVTRARALGSDDREIHDTVLIAAAFCMFNRYVDGLATWAPRERDAYDPMGAQMATAGYQRDRTAEYATTQG